MISLELVSLVHSDILVDQLVHLLVHVIGQPSSYQSPVTKYYENQQDEEPYYTQDDPHYYMLRFWLERQVLTLCGSSL